jgi:hypothetical protein
MTFGWGAVVCCMWLYTLLLGVSASGSANGMSFLSALSYINLEPALVDPSPTTVLAADTTAALVR